MDILQVCIMGFPDLSSWKIQTFYGETVMHCIPYKLFFWLVSVFEVAASFSIWNKQHLNHNRWKWRLTKKDSRLNLIIQANPNHQLTNNHSELKVLKVKMQCLQLWLSFLKKVHCMFLNSARLLNQLTEIFIQILHILATQGLPKLHFLSKVVLWSKTLHKKVIQK